MLPDKDVAVNQILNGMPNYYRVNFPLQSPLPKPIEIILNGQILCSAPKGLY